MATAAYGSGGVGNGPAGPSSVLALLDTEDSEAEGKSLFS